MKIDKNKLHEVNLVDKSKTVKDIAYIVGNDTPDALFVTDNNAVVGVVTDTDIIMKIAKKDFDSDDITVEEIMSTPIVSIDVNKTIEEAIELMVKKDVQKLLVMQKGKPLGVMFGEDVLKFSPDKWKQIIFSQTINEVYKIVKKNSSITFTETYNAIADMDKFTNLESDIEFNLYVYQEGLVLVAYYFIQENSNKKLSDIRKYIRKHYQELLDKYSTKEQ